MSIAAIIAWIRRLEALIYLLLGGGSSGAPGALATAVWWQDYVGGSDTNPGTPLLPVKTLGEIRRRWGGGVLGVRPQLRVAVEIHAVSNVPANDFTDPALALADVDLPAGAALLIVPGGNIIKRSGVIHTVPNAFARTPTGQQTITDLGVANWNGDVDLLLNDTTSGAACWVVTGGAAGTISASRTAADVTAPPYNGLGAAAVAPADAYQIIQPRQLYLGSGSKTRAFPSLDATTQTQVQFWRFHFVQGPGGAADVALIEGDAVFTTENVSQSGASVFFEDCKFDTLPVSQYGGLYFVNCAFMAGAFLGCAPGDGTTYVFAGYGRADLLLAGLVTVDQDYVGIGFGLRCASVSPEPNFVGNAGSYGAGAAPAFIGSGRIQFGPQFDVGGTFYGSTAAAVVIEVEVAGVATISNPPAHTTTFNFNIDAFDLASTGGNAWGFDEGAGVYVGPTTCTFAHLDAALGAGTGFGHFALDPRTLAMVGYTT